MAMKQVAAAVIVAGMVAPPALATELQNKEEQKLEKRLEGRIAGEPVRCIRLHRIDNTIVYNRTAIVFEIGPTLYVNRPDAGKNSLRRDDVMVTKSTNGQLCDVDTVRMTDQNGITTGHVFLGDFVPYKRVDQG